MNKIKASHVFTPGTIPEYTYNERKEVELEENLREELEYGGKIIVLSGPTKIGKTVLVRKCLPKEKVVRIEPDDLKGTMLEEAIALLIDIPSEESNTIRKEGYSEEQASVGAKASMSFNFLQIFKSRFYGSMGLSKQDSLSKEVTQEYRKSLLKESTKFLIENDYILVFDDFHYIEKEQQTKIIHKLKPYILENLHVCVILIPNKQTDVVNAESDMEARIQNFEVPEWGRDELGFIPKSGFGKLNIQLPQEIIDSFIENSFKNPYLLQEICAYFCRVYKIKEQNENLKELEIEVKDLEKVYTRLPETNVNLLQRLKDGKATKGQQRGLYVMKNGEELDLYKIILVGLAEVVHETRIPIKSFVDTLNKLTSEDAKKIRRSDVVATLKKMVEICKESSRLEPPLDYNSETERIVLNDPFFSFAIKWQS